MKKTILAVIPALFFTVNVASAGALFVRWQTQLPPVENKPPNTHYEAAIPGQTRAAGMKTKAPYQVHVLTDQLSRPWSIAELPDGRFLITQKSGTMRIVTTTGKLSEPIAGLPKVNAADQGGLLGLALDPAYQDNRI